MISFIVPTLPDEPYLKHTLNSILEEIDRNPLENMEVIVVGKDNESRNLAKLMEQLSSPYIRYFDIDGNRSEARNFGIRMARNNFLTFVDADTIIGRNFIPITLDDFRSNYAYILYSTLPLEQSYLGFIGTKFIDVNAYLIQMIRKHRFPGYCCSLRKDILEKVKVGNEYFLKRMAGHGEDSELASRYGKFCRSYGLRGRFERRVKVYTSVRELKRAGVGKALARLAVDTTLGVVWKRPVLRNWREL
ncbi:MAG: glycosyltransferase [Candidatus Nanoarchaeia archaeon]|nr:glycosyltransferase [Candidatus Haiyanarchaeum thermophilum]MCW1302859.1 glycosyltransferase [Candidatus Haiyanarchaeum thermophilum]MCW1303539.1 glycosyltransferase [Candidatus Haiyanarchaeum thermophilum]MCW1306902.1 glycosyltransferase [Candidatus Haiyanarchaeum thermophilum]MCW1307325.1 glycosyltransferase [Candidatus Haiyanarchaeum thermophilum]